MISIFLFDVMQFFNPLPAVHIIEAPIDMTLDRSSVEVMEKEDATFVCELSKPDLDVIWMVNGKKIKPSDKYEMITEGTTYKLIIKDCQLSDAAEISIIAKDCKSTAQLIVKGTSQLLVGMMAV